MGEKFNGKRLRLGKFLESNRMLAALSVMLSVCFRGQMAIR
jgi:hypothetical protein